MPRVMQSPQSRSDLKAIGRYIAGQARSVSVARRFVRSLVDACQVYASNPQMGEWCPELGKTIRRFTEGNYNIYFRPAANGIEVVRVLHGSRDQLTAWRSLD